MSTRSVEPPRATLLPRAEHRRTRSAWRRRSRRSPRSTSASASTTASACTDTPHASRRARQLERLAALPLDERRRVPALDPERAPVIVAGGAILLAILDATSSSRSGSASETCSTARALAAAELPSRKRARRLPAPTPAARARLSRAPARPPAARPRRGAAARRRGRGRRRAGLPPRPPGTRSRSCSSRKRKAPSSSSPASRVKFGGSAMSRKVTLRRIATRSDDLSHERLPRHDAEEPPAVIRDEDRAHLAGLREAAARLLRARACGERRRLGHHRVADGLGITE